MNSKLEFLYHSIVSPSDYVNFHSHSCCELIYYIKGYGTTLINNVVYNYKPGSFSIILPNIPHNQKHTENTEVLYIGFTNDTMLFKLDNGLYLDNIERVILTLMTSMKHELREKYPHYEIVIDGLFKSLIVYMDRIVNKPVSKIIDFSYITNFIQENCSQKINFLTLAELSAMSYSRFRVLFKQHTGLSPVNYLLSQRIEKSKILLEKTSLNVTAIALDCGFYDHSQFSKVFVRLVGYTPKKYRQQLQLL